MTIFLIGFMGSGKTYLGKILSSQMDIPLIDLDEWIEKREKRSISKIFEQEGELAFRLMETTALHELDEMSQSGMDLIVSTGGGTPCFHDNMDLMNRIGTTIWLNPPINILLSRLVNEKDHRPLLAGLTNEQMKDFVNQKIQDRIVFYKKAMLQVNDAEIDVEGLIKQIKYASDIQ